MLHCACIMRAGSGKFVLKYRARDHLDKVGFVFAEHGGQSGVLLGALYASLVPGLLE